VKINQGFNSASTGPAGAASSASERASGTREPIAPGPAQDKVSISDLSRSLAALEARIAGGEAVFDAARVEEIKKAIAEGRFNVDAGSVADSLLESVQELLARKA
jgi:negative regulator of flagellin synthesis FlgM